MFNGKPIPKPYVVPANPKYFCLRDGEWLSDEIVNEYCSYIIKHHKKESSYLVMPSYIFCIAARTLSIEQDLGKKSQELCFLNSNEALNREALFVIMNSDLDRGAHWYLGVILFRTRTILIVDSLSQDYGSSFEILGKMAAYSLAGIVFEQDLWTFITASDCPAQTNGFDCGIHVCLNLTGIVDEEIFSACPVMKDKIWWNIS